MLMQGTMRHSLRYLGILTLVLVQTSTALAGVFTALEHLQSQFETPAQEPKFRVFYTSTEMQISRAKPILDQAPEGLYVTVGADRGFRAASLSSKVTHLLLLDVSSRIVRYNKLNIELLKATSL